MTITDMCFCCCFCDFDWQTFWTAAGTIVTIIAAFWGFIQWGEQGFINLDNIFTEDKFREARRNILDLWDNKATDNDFKSLLGKLDAKDISTVARRMNQICYPRPFLPENQVIKTWGAPIGKAWGLLQDYVEYERTKEKSSLQGNQWKKFINKWIEFKELGEKCFKMIAADLSEDDMKNIKTKAGEILEHFKKEEKKN